MTMSPAIEALHAALPRGPWNFHVLHKRTLLVIERKTFWPDQWRDAQQFAQSRILAGFGIATELSGTPDEQDRQIDILRPVGIGVLQ